MIDLSKNTNPFYPNKKILQVMKKTVSDIKNYPESIVTVDKTKFLGKYLLKNNIIATNGTMDAMNVILKTLKLKKIGMYSPTFWGIEYNSKLNGYDITKIKFNDEFEYDYDELNNLSKKMDVIYLCNYNNPTLSYLSRDVLYKLIKNNPQCRYIIDETVLAFNTNFNNITFVKYINELKNVDILISCSKIFGISGIRLGLIFSNEDNIEQYKENIYVYSVNIFANAFAKNLLSEFDKLQKVRIKMKNNMEEFINKINNSEVIKEIKNCGASFIFVELNPKIKYNEFIDYLMKSGIRVSDTNNVYSDLKKKYIRISVGKKKELNSLAILINNYHI